jgi:hypothetical protein
LTFTRLQFNDQEQAYVNIVPKALNDVKGKREFGGGECFSSNLSGQIKDKVEYPAVAGIKGT